MENTTISQDLFIYSKPNISKNTIMTMTDTMVIRVLGCDETAICIVYTGKALFKETRLLTRSPRPSADMHE